jgi:hypothetical protein
MEKTINDIVCVPQNEDYIEVDVPHFKSRVKCFRNSAYTSSTAITDIVDNIKINFECLIQIIFNNGKPHSIQISDNDEKGFENIKKKGEKNPFNMGHQNNEQTSDEFMNEFGVGLKEGGGYLAEYLEVVTRIVSEEGKVEYYNVTFDYIKMCNEPDAKKSYQPVIISVPHNYYHEKHTKVTGFSCGSSIILKELRKETDSCLKGDTEEEQINNIKELLSKTYSTKIREEGKIIKVNGQIVEPQIDLFNVPECKERTISVNIYIKLDEIEKEIKEIIFKKNTDDENSKWNLETKRSNKRKKGEKKEIYEPDSSFISCILKSTSTLNTEYADIMNNNMLSLERNGRNHGEISLLKERGDNYMKHIKNTFYWKSKKLNKFIGIGSTKGKNTIRDNPLMECLKKFLTDLSSEKDYGLHKSKFNLIGHIEHIDNNTDNTDNTDNTELLLIQQLKEELSHTSTQSPSPIPIPKKENKKIKKNLIIVDEKKEEVGKNNEEAEVINEAKKEVINEAKEEVINEAKEEVINEAKEEVINEIEEEVIKETEEEVINEAKEEVINETEEEVIDQKAKEEVINEKAEVIINETEEEVIDQKKEKVINEKEEEVIDQKKEEVIDETEEEVIKEKELPQVISVGNYKQIYYTISNGLDLLNKWYLSRENSNKLDELINNLIKKYQHRCPEDQSNDYLLFMTFEQKYKCLLYLINKKYPGLEMHETTSMLGGCDIYREYKIYFEKT